MPYRLATAQQNPRMVRIVKRRAGAAYRELRTASDSAILAGRRLWSRQKESNPRPAVYKSAALPTEL